MKKKIFLLITVLFLSIAFLSGEGFAQAKKSKKGLGGHIKPYGNLYLFFGGNYASTYNSGQTQSIDTDLLYRINDNSNLGFSFTYKKYSGVFELGIDDIDNDRKVKIRKAYGEYKLGFGDLLIGQNWSPYVCGSHESADYYRSEGFGAMYEDPTLQIKVSIGGFYIDLMKPYIPTREMSLEQAINFPTSGSGSSNEYKDVKIERDVTTGQPMEYIKFFFPKVALGYEYKSKAFSIAGGIAGNVYYIDNTEDDIQFSKKWIYSYLAYVNTDFKFFGFSAKFSGGFLVNPANFGITVQSAGNTTYTGGAAMALENIATGEWEIKDTWNVQSYLELGYRFTSNTIMHLGYGFSLMKYPADNTEYDLAMEYYGNIKINLGGLIALTPSVAFRDYMKDMSGQSEGFDIYAGILATVSYY
ncbi:MAG: hypothetical protein GY754_02410 [bacterium]|nr:hypothetical protein [bacterium]